MSVQELRRRLDADEVALIDVREPSEHKSESIPEACLIPLAEISNDKLPSKSRTVVIHCRSGKRSMTACEKLVAVDPDLEVYNLEGGIMAWMQAGFDVKRSTSVGMSLERQTLLVAGFFVFLGFALGLVISPKFHFLSGFVGLGLMFGGLTGWCGMTKLLARMPWNRA